jgi:predicted CopG family antitoxin
MSNTAHKMTQVGITVETRAQLRLRRITKHESYDEVINRLLDEKKSTNGESPNE